jgi:hypothetical protein
LLAGRGTVVIHTSVRGLVAVLHTPALLSGSAGSGSAASARGRSRSPSSGWGSCSGAVVLYDHPSRVQFDRDGVHRVCPLRRHTLPWDRLHAIERPRPTSIATLRNLRERPDEPIVSGGLLARGRGRRRRWLLSDRLESRDEYDRLRELLLMRCRPPSGCAPRAPRRRPADRPLPVDAPALTPGRGPAAGAT